MKRFPISIVLVSLFLAFSVLFNLVGCTMDLQAQDLMTGVYAHLVDGMEQEEKQNYSSAISDFSFNLFKECRVDSENTLISPFSVLYALAMTANGAGGETLKQMESVLGMSIADLNKYLYSYMECLPEKQEYHRSEFLPANSIWFDKENGFIPKQEFLQNNADYYGAELYSIPFNEDSVEIINDWVKENTKDTIPSMVDKFDENTVMILLNALLFESQWKNTYNEESVKIGVFTKEDGTEQRAEFMYNMYDEGYYLEDDKATGFMKSFCDTSYKFIALLPKEGVSVSDCVDSLNGDSVENLLDNGKWAEIDTAIPKFETEFSVELDEILRKMGMVDAFEEGKADFSNMGSLKSGTLSIGEITHKANIKVDEMGVVAGAATQVSIIDVGGGPDEQRKVYLDRPFIYVLYDSKNHIPLFIGTMMDVQK